MRIMNANMTLSSRMFGTIWTQDRTFTRGASTVNNRENYVHVWSLSDTWCIDTWCLCDTCCIDTLSAETHWCQSYCRLRLQERLAPATMWQLRTGRQDTNSFTFAQKEMRSFFLISSFSVSGDDKRQQEASKTSYLLLQDTKWVLYTVNVTCHVRSYVSWRSVLRAHVFCPNVRWSVLNAQVLYHMHKHSKWCFHKSAGSKACDRKL